MRHGKQGICFVSVAFRVCIRVELYVSTVCRQLYFFFVFLIGRIV
jgi:hypothetical protein